MAAAFSGYRYGGTGPDVATATINPNLGGSGSGGTACNVGDWMILVITGGSGPVDTDMAGDGSGWTIVRSFAGMTGTTAFQTGVWMKRRDVGETSYAWPLDGTGYGVYWTLTWYSGAENAYAGTFWDRNGNATNLTNIAPSVTTTVDNSVVVSISTERTVATETDSQITVDNGMTKRLLTTSGGDQNVSVADKTIATAGVSGNTTWTYPNTQTNNGLAGHIWLTPSIAPASGAPYIVGAAQTVFAGTGASVTVNVPSGYQTGDLLVAALRNQASNSPTDWDNASFTRVGPAFVANSSSARVTGFYSHEITGSEPMSYTFTIGVPASRIVGAMFLVRGADPAWVAYYNSITGDTITNGRTVPSYTANDPALVLEFAASEFAAPNDHIPSNYPDNFSQMAEVVTNGTVSGSSRTYMWLGSRTLSGTSATTGSTDTDIAWAGTPSAPVALSIAFRPSGAANPDFTAKIGDTGGILTDVVVRVGDTGSVLSQISGMRAMLPRYYNVTQMLAQPEFFWAHRGGSRDFPEMSSFAYGQSALLSYGCLELSLARTSDGVWFGLHDADINRTSGTTGLAAASAMTWATVQGYQILGSMAANNSTQANQPYAKLQDILNAYSKHLFVIDVKYANTYREELLDILDTYGGSERFVGKAYGVGSNSFATSCSNRGYQRWGYFYGSDIPSLTSAYVNQWTLIGMDYTATLSDWNTLAGYRTNGQRMSGHICPDTTAVATARSYGATGFMVSGAVTVKPS
jgi:hypothetical protein